MINRLALIAVVLLSAATAAGADGPFVHPGILHTRADLDRMRALVAAGRQPWAGGFALLRDSPYAQSSYKLRGPVPVLTRDPKRNVGKAELESDADAAYQNAIAWAVTGDAAHAAKAAEILNAWGRTLRQINGHDAQLAAGLYPFLLTNAAEILRATYPRWTAADAGQFQRMLHTAVDPVIGNFATFANGNWDGACMKQMLAEAVFCDDRRMFDRATDYYRHGRGDGSIEHYVNATGECQESGRDQQHTQLGLGLLAECCQVAANQGVDLWAAGDDRLLKGFEYTARYNLGDDVPFEEYRDTTGKADFKTISPQGRGRFRSVWEIAYAHYHSVEHLPMPQTQRVLDRIRPEGPPFGADHPGFGTVLFCLPDANP